MYWTFFKSLPVCSIWPKTHFEAIPVQWTEKKDMVCVPSCVAVWTARTVLQYGIGTITREPGQILFVCQKTQSSLFGNKPEMNSKIFNFCTSSYMYNGFRKDSSQVNLLDRLIDTSLHKLRVAFLNRGLWPEAGSGKVTVGLFCVPIEVHKKLLWEAFQLSSDRPSLRSAMTRSLLKIVKG